MADRMAEIQGFAKAFFIRIGTDYFVFYFNGVRNNFGECFLLLQEKGRACLPDRQGGGLYLLPVSFICNKSVLDHFGKSGQCFPFTKSFEECRINKNCFWECKSA